VDPGETGPVEPEAGYETEVAVRSEVERVDGLGILVRFATATHRFENNGWLRLETTRIARSVLPNPTEFAADCRSRCLPRRGRTIDRPCTRSICRPGPGESAQRDGEAAARAAREQALREQRHVSDLLGE
jgi:hypothetical protein